MGQSDSHPGRAVRGRFLNFAKGSNILIYRASAQARCSPHPPQREARIGQGGGRAGSGRAGGTARHLAPGRGGCIESTYPTVPEAQGGGCARLRRAHTSLKAHGAERGGIDVLATSEPSPFS
eukprot:4799940-Pleurochrysis_carterae.AAC.7